MSLIISVNISENLRYFLSFTKKTKAPGRAFVSENLVTETVLDEAVKSFADHFFALGKCGSDLCIV